jgi:SAM-dependent methyltransferase
MEELRRRWDAAAVGWEAEREHVAEFAAPVAEALVDALAPAPADTVLDAAAGTGDVSAALSGRVARVIAVDLSPMMVEAARRRGLPGVEHQVMDVQALELPDDSVDGVVSRWGYMLVPDPPGALAEARRVLRPGGRLAFATWAPASRNPWATAYGPVLVERGFLEPPSPDEPGQFYLGDPEKIEAVVRGAGFDEISVEEVPVSFRATSWDHYRRIVTSLAVSMRDALEQLDEVQRAEVDEAAQARIEAYRSGEGYVLPGVSLVTRAA